MSPEDMNAIRTRVCVYGYHLCVCAHLAHVSVTRVREYLVSRGVERVDGAYLYAGRVVVCAYTCVYVRVCVRARTMERVCRLREKQVPARRVPRGRLDSGKRRLAMAGFTGNGCARLCVNRSRFRTSLPTPNPPVVLSLSLSPSFRAHRSRSA